MGAVVNSFRSLRDLAGLFSQKGLAILAFFLVLFVFVINNTALCPKHPVAKATSIGEDLE